MATADGLKRFNRDGTTLAIDSGAISLLGLSGHGTAATWMRQADTGREVRFARTDRLNDVITLVGDSGWKAGATPNIIGVYTRAGSRALFVTNRGSFFYAQSEHRYTDASESVVSVSTGDEVKQTVEALSPHLAAHVRHRLASVALLEGKQDLLLGELVFFITSSPCRNKDAGSTLLRC